MKFIFKYLKDYRKTLVGVLFLATINQVFSLLDPQIFRLLVDNYAARVNELSKAEFFSGSGLLLLGFVSVALISRIAKNFQDYYVNVITHRLGTKLYAESVHHSLFLPYKIFTDQSSGEILQKMKKAREDIQRIITGLINVLFVYILGIAFVLAYAFWVHWLIGLVIFLVVPTLGITIFLISRRIKNIQTKVVSQQASLAGFTTETLRNIELVKSLGLEQQEIDRLNKVNDAILDLELKRVKLVRTLSFIQGTLINGLRAFIMLVMLYLMYNQVVSLGQFFTLLFYSFFLFSPLAELANLAEQYQQARASSEELDKVLNIPPEPQPKNPIAIGDIYKISLKDVNFTYRQDGERALYDINLDIKAGESVAFVGPSGSGKTTLIKLLVKLFQITGGQILLNDQISLYDVANENLRKKIGLVSQETQLFSGTIRENLLFVRPEANEEECLKVLHMAAADSLVKRGDHGLDTKIGEGGLKLSGGEKQRLAIARALLRRPDILIFDEATSSLDSLTERQITDTIKTIEAAHPQMISVLVAHRLSTIAHVKKIYVLEKGRIVEIGRHDDLIKQGGLYAALWREQSGARS
ncbi:MAG: ABC transporter ATP-binding protein [Candidatus Komeilibacteria bacterium RIFOXYC1_FULL_37_11]|uniref:ABC transporter ATP-binding protein n=1 Tax=Candidatus Komeilibacteria bacterium RIFOXYC1_FULL_37_11 TaxID=1798555 RepID=A0A1G2BYR1_9BACT|nr:MAG: ABC transporter ATP-binding protein [Candidatus Komeilibacteria bacterium RIFOXYC1_FULL_37_11]OGY96018.1 MAG: ABC transporter ATP-binding protein [Candidatus Komeilibacteria bacterium RIFOXYD1_FULL_37_29]